MGWIGVDFDGTLARYDGWKGETVLGEPIIPMVSLVKNWLAEGLDVRIFTARAYDFSEEGKAAIEVWCYEHIGQSLPITCVKDFYMEEFYDDRAVQVEFNTGEIVGYSSRGYL